MVVGLALKLAEAFNSELERIAESRTFLVGRKVWRAVWDDFRNWLQLGLEARERA